MTNSLENNNLNLTSREIDVFDFLIQGMPNKEIAMQLSISEKTIEKHITSIYKKLDVTNRSEAIIWAINHSRVFPTQGKSRAFPHRKISNTSLESPMNSQSFWERRVSMKTQDWFISLVAGVLLGVLSIGAGIPRMLSETRTVQATSEVDEIRLLLLNSHTKWSTASGEAEIIWYDPKGSSDTQTYISEFKIYQPLSAYVNVSNQDSPGFNDGELWISDGQKAYRLDKEAKTYTEGYLPKFANDLSILPRDLSQVSTDTVYNHPFSLLIPSPVKEYLYPEWFAQGNLSSAYTLEGEDSYLGRKVWILRLTNHTSQYTAWVDQETGIILKYLQEEDGRKFVEAHFTILEIDQILDTNSFSPPQDYRPATQFESGQ